MKVKIKKLLYKMSKERDAIAHKLEKRYNPYFDGLFDGVAIACHRLEKIILREDK